MDPCKEKQAAVEVNVTLNGVVSSPKATRKEHATYCVTPGHTARESVGLESQSTLTLTGVRKQLSDTHIDSDNENGSPRTPKGVLFNPFAPGPEDMVRAPQSRKYHEEVRNNIVRKLQFCSSPPKP